MTTQQPPLRERLASGVFLAPEKELRAILVLVVAFFCAFLALPAAMVLIRSFTGADGGASLGNYAATFADPDFLASIANSLTVSCAFALVATSLAFLLSCTVDCTNVPAPLKRAIVRPLAGARRRGRRRSRRQPGRKGRRGGGRGLRGRPGDHLLQRRPRGPGRLPDRAG